MAKTETKDLKKIEIWWLLRDIRAKGGYKNSVISWGNAGGTIGVDVSIDSSEQCARFHYNHFFRSKKTLWDYRVYLTATPCHFGGQRYWFQCPLNTCNRRVGVLYMANGLFGCRHCHNLTYRSKNEYRAHALYCLVKGIRLQQQIDALTLTARRIRYKGNLTHKQRKIGRMYEQFLAAYGAMPALTDI